MSFFDSVADEEDGGTPVKKERACPRTEDPDENEFNKVQPIPEANSFFCFAQKNRLVSVNFS